MNVRRKLGLEKTLEKILDLPTVILSKTEPFILSSI